VNAEDLLKGGGGSAEASLKGGPEKPAVRPKHPWEAVTEASFDRSKPIPGSENLPHPARLLAETGAMLVTPGLGVGGRIAAQGLAGGISAMGEGKNPIKRGLMDAGIAATYEAILGALPYAKVPFMSPSLKEVAGRLTSREREFQKATEAPMKAYAALKDHVPTEPWMLVPSISKTPITFKEASEKLATLKGVDYEAAHQEILKELQRIDSVGAAAFPYGAEGFKTRTSPSRFDPASTGAERFAKGAVEGLRNPLTRAATDIAATTDIGGLPAGAAPFLMGGGGSLKGLASSLRFAR
jgi:hypothetical protein